VQEGDKEETGRDRTRQVLPFDDDVLYHTKFSTKVESLRRWIASGELRRSLQHSAAGCLWDNIFG
jgi:hypothetical protein